LVGFTSFASDEPTFVKPPVPENGPAKTCCRTDEVKPANAPVSFHRNDSFAPPLNVNEPVKRA